MSFAEEYRRVTELVPRARRIGYQHDDADPARASLPEALRHVLFDMGRSPLSLCHNRLFAPGSLVPDRQGFIVFAEENQGVLRWAYHQDEARYDARVYQAYFDTKRYGPWVEEGQSMSDFLVSFAYWNAANGAAAATAVGECGPATVARVADLPLIWRAPDFEVRGRRAYAVVTDDDDLYVFAADRQSMAELVRHLEPAWSDFEPRGPSADAERR